MKSFAISVAMLMAGMGVGNALPPWQDSQQWELGDVVSIITITVPEADVQAHFACQRLTSTN